MRSFARQRVVRLVVAIVALAACGGSQPTATVSPSPPVREVKIVMAGALSGPFQVIADPLNSCASHLADDPRSVNYIIQGHVEGTSRDIGVTLNFAVRGYAKPGTFAVGAYPAGSAAMPAIAVVEREITARDIPTWISGSGSVVVDIGARSGTLDLQLNSTSGLGGLTVSGPWVCAPGSQ